MNRAETPVQQSNAAQLRNGARRPEGGRLYLPDQPAADRAGVDGRHCAAIEFARTLPDWFDFVGALLPMAGAGLPGHAVIEATPDRRWPSSACSASFFDHTQCFQAVLCHDSRKRVCLSCRSFPLEWP
jgi:hypothetical protein